MNSLDLLRDILPYCNYALATSSYYFSEVFFLVLYNDKINCGLVCVGLGPYLMQLGVNSVSRHMSLDIYLNVEDCLLNNIKIMPCVEGDRSDCQPEASSIARSLRAMMVVEG